MDTKERKKVILLGVLGVAVLGLFWFQFFRTPGGAVAPPTDAAPVLDPTVAVANLESVFQEVDINIKDLVKSIKEVDFDYQLARIARDPMAPLLMGIAFDQKRHASSGLNSATMSDSLVYEANRKTVTGIIWDESNPMAVIREPGYPEQIVEVADKIGSGIVVKAIEQNHVVFALSLDNETVEIVKELAKEQ